jgi:hypothetical protein
VAPRGELRLPSASGGVLGPDVQTQSRWARMSFSSAYVSCGESTIRSSVTLLFGRPRATPDSRRCSHPPRHRCAGCS